MQTKNKNQLFKKAVNGLLVCILTLSLLLSAVQTTLAHGKYQESPFVLQVPETTVSRHSARLTPAEQKQAELLALQIADALQFNANGTLALRPSIVARMTLADQTLLRQFVWDVNSRKIGLAITTETGTQVYGNPNARTITNKTNGLSVTKDQHYVHVFFTRQWYEEFLKSKSFYKLVGVLAGATKGLICKGFVVCGVIVRGLVIALSFFLAYYVYQLLPERMTLKIPRPNKNKRTIYLNYWKNNNEYERSYLLPAFWE